MVVISNQPRALRSSDFEITRVITQVSCTPLDLITIRQGMVFPLKSCIVYDFFYRKFLFHFRHFR